MQILWVTTLVSLLLAAVACDLRTRRIPNLLVGSGIALGLLFQAVVPSGGGLLATPGGSLGIASALLGGAVGLGLFLPLYAMRAMGAGDVKLLAMVGVWLGAKGVLWAALWALLAGGVLSLAAALWSGVLRQVLDNLHFMLTTALIRVQTHQGLAIERPAVLTTGRLPYALAIACGTLIELARPMLHTSA